MFGKCFFGILLVLFCLNLTRAGDKAKLKEANSLHDEGQKFFKQKKYDLAFKSFSKEIHVRKKLEDLKGEALANIYAASSLQEQSKYSKSIRYLNVALERGLKLKDNNIVGTCYGMLARAYKETGDDIKAREYYTNFMNFKDHVENQKLKNDLVQKEEVMNEISEELEETEHVLEETEKNLEEVEMIARNRKMKLDLEKRKNELNAAKLEKEELEKKKLAVESRNQKLELRSRRIVIYSLCGGIVLILGMLGVVIKGYKQKKKDGAIIEYQNEKIVSSISYASRIQSAMLPVDPWIRRYLPEFFVLYMPVSIVSGDFYFFSDEDEDGAVYLSVVDCTGHGVPGALMSMIGYNSLNEIVRSGEKEVDVILNKLHKRIVRALKQGETKNKDGMDIAFCKIDMKNQTVEFAGARNPLIYIQDGEKQIVPADKRPIGGVFERNFAKFNKHTIKIDKPTTLYLFSDGFADQFGGDQGRKFYSRKMYELFEEIHLEPMEIQGQLLEERYHEWRGSHPRVDDVCIIGWRMQGVPFEAERTVSSEHAVQTEPVESIETSGQAIDE